MDGVLWLVLSTSGLLVLLNLGIGALALWSYRSGLWATERLLASGEVDVYHATWLIGSGYERSAPWGREREAAETALRSLTGAGLVHLDQDARLVPTAEADADAGAGAGADCEDEADQQGVRSPEHPLDLEAWQFTFGSWSVGHPVTVEALAAHPAFKTACAAHAERLSGYLPSYRIRHDDRARRAPFAVGLIVAGWLTLGTCLLLGWSVFGEPGTGPGGPAAVVGVLAATLATAVLSVIVLVALHYFIWQAWQDRWPRRLREHCRDVVQRESRDWLPLSRIPWSDDGH
ncbi:hypothetical protein [Streptomyces sp. NBC_01217]|uniref:hypothetical protein n=1 Tax=Streptomyces sp. NBC_01217 TaxID=2903779 RepID=UPI002E1376A8|nr:hypothetical protein OG507_04030 [Streptomyces sp. NBC_01217]